MRDGLPKSSDAVGPSWTSAFSVAVNSFVASNGRQGERSRTRGCSGCRHPAYTGDGNLSTGRRAHSNWRPIGEEDDRRRDRSPRSRHPRTQMKSVRRQRTRARCLRGRGSVLREQASRRPARGTCSVFSNATSPSESSEPSDKIDTSACSSEPSIDLSCDRPRSRPVLARRTRDCSRCRRDHRPLCLCERRSRFREGLLAEEVESIRRGEGQLRVDRTDRRSRSTHTRR